MSVSFDIFRAEAGRWKTPVTLAKKEINAVEDAL